MGSLRGLPPAEKKSYCLVAFLFMTCPLHRGNMHGDKISQQHQKILVSEELLGLPHHRQLLNFFLPRFLFFHVNMITLLCLNGKL